MQALRRNPNIWSAWWKTRSLIKRAIERQWIDAIENFDQLVGLENKALNQAARNVNLNTKNLDECELIWDQDACFVEFPVQAIKHFARVWCWVIFRTSHTIDLFLLLQLVCFEANWFRACEKLQFVCGSQRKVANIKLVIRIFLQNCCGFSSESDSKTRNFLQRWHKLLRRHFHWKCSLFLKKIKSKTQWTSTAFKIDFISRIKNAHYLSKIFTIFL